MTSRWMTLMSELYHDFMGQMVDWRKDKTMEHLELSFQGHIQAEMTSWHKSQAKQAILQGGIPGPHGTAETTWAI